MSDQFVHFGLDNDVDFWKHGNQASAYPIQRRFFALWEKYGILNLPGQYGDYTEISKMRSLMTTTSRVLWRKVLKSRTQHNKLFRICWPGQKSADIDYIDIVGDTSIDLLLNELDKNQLDLICIAGLEKATNIGLTGEEISKHLEELDVELCPIEYLDQSRAFDRAIELSEKSYVVGDSVDNIWKERFSTIASSSNEVVIIDRFALFDLVKHQENSGIVNFLVRLGAEAKDLAVTIYSEIGQNDRPTRYFTTLEELISDQLGGIAHITTRIVDDRTMKDRAHNRSIRFGNSKFEIDNGVSIFQHSPLISDFDCTLVSKSEEDNQRESILSIKTGYSDTIESGEVYINLVAS